MTYLASRVKIRSHTVLCNTSWYKMLRLPSNLHTKPPKNQETPLQFVQQHDASKLDNFFMHFADDIHFWHLITFHRMFSPGTMPSQFCHGLLVRNLLIFALPKAAMLSRGGGCSYVQRHPYSGVVIWFTLVTGLEYGCYYCIYYVDGEGGACMQQMEEGRHMHGADRMEGMHAANGTEQRHAWDR